MALARRRASPVGAHRPSALHRPSARIARGDRLDSGQTAPLNGVSLGTTTGENAGSRDRFR
jgi:hypothetical protein